MILEIVSDCIEFIMDEESRLDYPATNLYTYMERDDGLPYLRMLIPDGFNATESITFTRVIIVPIDEASSRVPIDYLAKVARDMTEEPLAEKAVRASSNAMLGLGVGSAISQTIYIFLIHRMIGRFHSRMIAKKDLFLFFNVSKMTRVQVEYRIKYILGKLFLKRAEGIIKSTYEQIGKEPFGYLARVVEFFQKIGNKLYRSAMRYFKKIERPPWYYKVRKFARAVRRAIAEFWRGVREEKRKRLRGQRVGDNRYDKRCGATRIYSNNRVKTDPSSSMRIRSNTKRRLDLLSNSTEAFGKVIREVEEVLSDIVDDQIVDRSVRLRRSSNGL